MTEKLSSRYQKLFLERPIITVALLILFAVVMAIGLKNFKLDASADSMTLESDRDLDYFREIFKRYDTGDILVVTFTPDQDLYSAESLASLKALRDELAEVDRVKSVLSILDVPLLYSPLLGLGDLGGELKKITDDGVDLELAKGEFSKNPIYKDTLVGPDGKTTVVMLNLEVDSVFISLVRERDALLLRDKSDDLSAQEKQRLEEVSQEFLDYRTQTAIRDSLQVQQVREIAGRYDDNAQLFVGGALMITNDMMEFVRGDLKTFGLGILVFTIVILAVIFRQPRLVFLPLFTCVLTAIVMLGMLSWLDWRLTVISSNFVALLLIITLAVSIHLVVFYQEASRLNPQLSQKELAVRTVNRMARPCLYTTLTTIVAFASLVFSDIRPVIDFGWMMTLGAFVSLILTFITIPTGLCLLGGKGATDYGNENPRYTRVFANVVERFPTAILLVAGLVAAVALYGISQLKVENRFIDYFKSDTEIHQGMKVIDRNLGGTMSFDIVLDAPDWWGANSEAEEAFEDDDFGDDSFDADFADDSFDQDSFSDDPFAESDPFDDDPFGDDPFGEDSFGEDAFGGSGAAQAGAKKDYSDSYWWNRQSILQVEKFHDYLESQPEIGKVNSIATSYKLARDLNRGADLNDIELTFMRQNLGAELEASLITPYLSDEVQQTRISTRVIESEPGLSRSELIARIEEFGVKELGLKPEKVRATGLIVLYNNMLQSLFGSQIQTLAAVFIGIMLMFMVLFRSVMVSLIAIVPNILGAGVVLGFMGLVGIPLDIMTITIAAITVGMGVDHAIHYIHRFKTELVKDYDYLQTMKRSHQTIGRALFYTAITIILGFSLLSLSNFIPSIYFGLLTALAMFANTLLSLMLLPRLLILFKPFRA